MDERRQPFVLFGYRLFYVFLLCAIFYLCLAEVLPFGEMIPLYLFILAVLSAVISALDSLKGRYCLYGAVAFVAVYGLVILGYGDSREKEGGGSGSVFFREMLYLMVIVLGIYLFQLLAEKFIWIRRMSAFLFLGGLVAVMVCKWQIPHLGVAAVLLYAAAVLTEYIESRWKKQKQGSETAYLLWLLPFLAGYFLLTAVVPYKDTPYDWAFFVNLYGRIQERVIAFSGHLIHFGREDFGISTTGFSDEGGFFGSLDRSDKVVMVIDNPYHYGGSVYLAGKSYNSFDGRQWGQETTDGEKDCYLDTAETLCAVYGYEGEYFGDYLRKRTIGVRYQSFHTGYLFAPLKTTTVTLAEGSRAEVRQQGGGFLFSKKQGYGTSYQLSYYQLNQANPVFGEMVSAAGELSGQGYLNRASAEISKIGGSITQQELADYQERVRSDYSQDIKLGPEVENFLREATAGAVTDYEKLLRLESALSGLTYNERPGKLPAGVDTKEKFLDYFLVESREGYCSYFASAFVLLAEKEGMPARYVQGYVVPLAGRDRIEVTESMAHAWPEVWFEGIGWVPFEPTPGFYEQSKAFWEAHRREELQEEAVQEDLQEKGGTLSNPSGDMLEETEEDTETLLLEAERARRKEILYYLGCFALMIAFLGILLLLVDALWERRRAAGRSVGESFRLETLRNLQVLAALGYRRGVSETLSELKDRLTDHDITAYGDFFDVCEQVLYGGREPDEGSIAYLGLVRKELMEKLKEKKGKAYLLSRIGLYLTRVR